MGSRPTASPSDYPEVGQVLEFMRERRGVVLEILEGMSEEDMSQPPPKGTPPIMPDVGSVFETVVWHEALHAGQITIARRALGHAPLVDAPPKSNADG
ncbi:MAG: DinB family protein [Planctomycetes bacterium]|nr:DinB family protein [Planctomycetota bacterium]